MSPKPVEYAPTAWNSQKPRDLPPGLDVDKLSNAQKALRRYPMNGRGVQCGEFLSNTGAKFQIDDLREMSDEEMDKDNEGMEQLCWYWPTWLNPAAVVDAIGGVAGFFAFGSALAAVLAGFIVGETSLPINMLVHFFSRLLASIILQRSPSSASGSRTSATPSSTAAPGWCRSMSVAASV